MAFPYPIHDALFELILSEEGHPEYPIDEPETFWAFFLSCFDCSKSDGGRLTEQVQKRLRALLNSQLFRGDNGEILGSKPTIPLQYAGNSFCMVGVSTDEAQQAEELLLLRGHNAVMPTDETSGQQRFTLSPNDKSMITKARNVFVLLQNRTAVANGLHLGYCLAGGLANLISPEVLDDKAKTAERFDLASTYDNVNYNPYLKTVSSCDPFADAYAIKRAAATRQMFDKGGSILRANFEGAELDAALAVLEEVAPNGNRQSFRAQPSATAIPDPSRVLRDACPSAATLEKTKKYMDPKVYAHWVQASKAAPAYFINDFVALTDEDDFYNPNRLRFPVSASFIGHITPEKVALLPLSATPGKIGRDNYQFVCVSLSVLMRPGLMLYPHEEMVSILSGIAFRFKSAADFIGFMKESASSTIEDIEKGEFRKVLSGSNFDKVFGRQDATVEEMVELLKQIAYLNFPKFQADYLCEDKFLESAYVIPKLGNLTQELDRLWAVSIETIRMAVHRFKEENANAQQPVAMRQ